LVRESRVEREHPVEQVSRFSPGPTPLRVVLKENVGELELRLQVVGEVLQDGTVQRFRFVRRAPTKRPVCGQQPAVAVAESLAR